jgi:hypothetical protein
MALGLFSKGRIALPPSDRLVRATRFFQLHLRRRILLFALYLARRQGRGTFREQPQPPSGTDTVAMFENCEAGVVEIAERCRNALTLDFMIYSPLTRND